MELEKNLEEADDAFYSAGFGEDEEDGEEDEPWWQGEDNGRIFDDEDPVPGAATTLGAQRQHGRILNEEDPILGIGTHHHPEHVWATARRLHRASMAG